MRGKAHDFTILNHFSRITPAYAGKSAAPLGKDQMRRDHPRLCGEKAIVSRKAEPETGSPPPMRGKVSKHKSRAKAMGITPAYAGKRKYKKHTNDHAKDHPRLCGEKPEAQILKVR